MQSKVLFLNKIRLKFRKYFKKRIFEKTY